MFFCFLSIPWRSYENIALGPSTNFFGLPGFVSLVSFVVGFFLYRFSFHSCFQCVMTQGQINRSSPFHRPSAKTVSLPILFSFVLCHFVLAPHETILKDHSASHKFVSSKDSTLKRRRFSSTPMKYVVTRPFGLTHVSPRKSHFIPSCSNTAAVSVVTCETIHFSSKIFSKMSFFLKKLKKIIFFLHIFNIFEFLLLTWIFPGTPVVSILDAMLTASPQIS